jgi:anaerobic magnesium-protoporphyrin IX monomethyl ester cyclase
LKAVVVIPPVFDFYYTPHRSSGLGSEILLNLLEASSFQAVLFNFPLQSKRPAKQNLPQALNYLKPYIIENEFGSLSFFSHYQRFGPSIPECTRQILQNEPDLICISCFAFCYAQPALDLAENIRSLNSHPVIIVGGAGVSAYPEFFIKNPAVDFAFTGEAEVSVPLFLDIFRSKGKDFSTVPNLYHISDGRIVVPINVKRTKSEDISFVLKKTFETSDRIFFTTSLSRGCPKTCRFCSNFLSHGREFRTIPVEVVKEKLAEFDQSQIKKEKIVCVNFEDDNLLCNPEYFLSVLKTFQSVFPNAGFFSENGIDYTLIQPDLLSELIECKMMQFNISLAALNPLILQNERRDASLLQYEEIMRTLKKYQIPSVTYFICGLKHDTKENVISTLVYLAGQPTRVGISFFYPVPGISDFQNKTFFDEKPAYLYAGSSAYPWNQSLSTREMVTAFRLSRFVNLLKLEKKSEKSVALINTMFHEQKLYTLVKYGKRHEITLVNNVDPYMVKHFFQKISLGGL